MNTSSFNNPDNVWTELPDSLRHSAQAIHNAQPPLTEMTSFLNKLAETSPECVSQVGLRGIAEPGRPLQSDLFAKRRLWRYGAGVTAVTACAIAILLMLPSSAANALDQLARALTGRACIKMSTTGQEGTSSEYWYMPGKNCSAWRNDEWIEFRDHETHIVQSFDRKEKKLYRSPDPVTRRTDHMIAIVESLCSLDGPTRPKQLDGLDITESRLRDVEINGAARRELQLTLRKSQEKDSPPVNVSLVIDPANHLPQILTASGVREGVNWRTVTRFEFPELGPADVFAMGVPADGPLINRIPSTDVQRLVSGVFAGRLRFDDYRAVVLKTDRLEKPSYEGGDVLLVAKKGTKSAYFRLSAALPQDLAARPREEVARYVLAHHDQFPWYPVAVTHGQTRYSFDTSFHYSDGKQVNEITAVQSYTDKNSAPEEFILPAWYDYPHFAGRPPLGIGRQDIAAAIATESEGGPEGCVLLQTQRSGRLPEAPAPADPPDVGKLAQAGFWIRADRDFLVMQESSTFDNDLSYQFVLDELARSPQGHWYPVKARSIHGSTKGSGQSPRTKYCSYDVEFGTEISDEMFDPHRYIGKR